MTRHANPLLSTHLPPRSSFQFALVSSIIVTIINLLLRYILGWITLFEGHPSIVAQERAIAFKVFISLFLNTSCIVLLINATPPDALSQYTLNGQPVFAGQHTGFDHSWHTDVGSSIVLTSACCGSLCACFSSLITHVIPSCVRSSAVLFNIVTPHLWSLCYLMFYLPCRKMSGDVKAVTQADLNEQFKPPEFEMPTRIAVIVSTVFTLLSKLVSHAEIPTLSTHKIPHTPVFSVLLGRADFSTDWSGLVW